MGLEALGLGGSGISPASGVGDQDTRSGNRDVSFAGFSTGDYQQVGGNSGPDWKAKLITAGTIAGSLVALVTVAKLVTGK